LNAHQIVEAVLFASDAPLTADEIARADESLDEDRVEDALQLLRAEYDDAGRSFEISELAEGYQILTRPEYAPYLERFDNVPRPSRLSGPAVETLAIIAYRQPIGRLEIEYIRGVGASGVVRTLQDRRLIDVVGRAEGLGRPLLYGTTQHFLEHFGFRSLEGLPRPEELPVILRERVSLEPESEPDPQLELESEVAADQSSAAAGETAPETETEAEDRTSVDDATAEPEGDMPDGDPDSDSVDVEDDAEAEPESDLERSDSV
jgi:segregation and condensation protein B